MLASSVPSITRVLYLSTSIGSSSSSSSGSSLSSAEAEKTSLLRRDDRGVARSPKARRARGDARRWGGAGDKGCCGLGGFDGVSGAVSSSAAAASARIRVKGAGFKWLHRGQIHSNLSVQRLSRNSRMRSHSYLLPTSPLWRKHSLQTRAYLLCCAWATGLAPFLIAAHKGHLPGSCRRDGHTISSLVWAVQAGLPASASAKRQPVRLSSLEGWGLVCQGNLQVSASTLI